MRNRPVLIGIAVALVLLVAFYFLAYKPRSDEQAAIEAETALLIEQEQQLQQQIAQLQEIKSREVEINAAMARLVDYIPNGPAQPSVIRQFQRTADAAGASIESVTFGDPTIPTAASGAAPTGTGRPGTTLANIEVSMDIQGGYFQIVDFFRRLEVDVPRAVLVQTIGVAESDEAGFPTLSATWTGQIFAVMPAADLADTAGGTGTTPAPGATPTPTPTPSPAGGDQ